MLGLRRAVSAISVTSSALLCRAAAAALRPACGDAASAVGCSGLPPPAAWGSEGACASSSRQASSHAAGPSRPAEDAAFRLWQRRGRAAALVALPPWAAAAAAASAARPYGSAAPQLQPQASERESAVAAGAAAPADEPQPESQLIMTDACVQRLRELTPPGSSVPATLRIAVDAGGCSGFQYTFSLLSPEVAAGPRAPEDMAFEQGGVVILVDDVSLPFLKGATVDYSEELIRASFQVSQNPNTVAACGCGSSFAAKT